MEKGHSHSMKWFHTLFKFFKHIFFRCHCNSTPWYPRKDLYANVHNNIIDNSSKSPQIIVSVNWYMDKNSMHRAWNAAQHGWTSSTLYSSVPSLCDISVWRQVLAWISLTAFLYLACTQLSAVSKNSSNQTHITRNLWLSVPAGLHPSVSLASHTLSPQLLFNLPSPWFPDVIFSYPHPNSQRFHMLPTSQDKSTFP